MPKLRWLTPDGIAVVEMVVGLALIFTGAAMLSLPAAFLLTGLLIWRDATAVDVPPAGSK